MGQCPFAQSCEAQYGGGRRRLRRLSPPWSRLLTTLYDLDAYIHQASNFLNGFTPFANLSTVFVNLQRPPHTTRIISDGIQVVMQDSKPHVVYEVLRKVQLLQQEILQLGALPQDFATTCE